MQRLGSVPWKILLKKLNLSIEKKFSMSVVTSAKLKEYCSRNLSCILFIALLRWQGTEPRSISLEFSMVQTKARTTPRKRIAS